MKGIVDVVLSLRSHLARSGHHMGSFGLFAALPEWLVSVTIDVAF